MWHLSGGDWWNRYLPDFFFEECLVVDFNSSFLRNCAVNYHDINLAPLLVKTVLLNVGVVAHAHIKVPVVDLFSAFDMFADMLAFTFEVLDPVGHFLGSSASFRLVIAHLGFGVSCSFSF